jgi:hypothetical protein
VNVDHVETDLVFEKSRYKVLDLGHESSALEGHLAQCPYYCHIVLVDLDRATAQGFDILMQVVTTRLELLERNHFQHFL